MLYITDSEQFLFKNQVEFINFNTVIIGFFVFICISLCCYQWPSSHEENVIELSSLSFLVIIVMFIVINVKFFIYYGFDIKILELNLNINNIAQYFKLPQSYITINIIILLLLDFVELCCISKQKKNSKIQSTTDSS